MSCFPHPPFPAIFFSHNKMEDKYLEADTCLCSVLFPLAFQLLGSQPPLRNQEYLNICCSKSLLRATEMQNVVRSPWTLTHSWVQAGRFLRWAWEALRLGQLRAARQECKGQQRACRKKWVCEAKEQSKLKGRLATSGGDNCCNLSIFTGENITMSNMATYNLMIKSL